MNVRRGAVAGLLSLWSCSGEIPEIKTPEMMRGHQEVIVQGDGSLLPVALSGSGKVGLCFEVEPSEDTRQWQMTFSFGGRPSPSGAVKPAARSGLNVCFDAALPADLRDGTLDVCSRLFDEFDGTEYRVPCQRMHHLRDSSTYKAVLTRRKNLLDRADELDLDELLTQLDDIAQLATENGFNLLTVQITSLALRYLTLEGTPEALDEAKRRLADLPVWLDQPPASQQAAQAATQQAMLLRDAHRLDEAWSELAVADRRFQAIADPQRLTVARAQASILHQLGLVDEAIRRLRGALMECEPRITDPDDRRLVEAARCDLAWYILMNPDANEEELDEAESYLREDLEDRDADTDRLDLANRRVNRAYLEVRRGQDPAATLASARRTLATVQLGTARGQYLSSWADLVEGSGELARGNAVAALELCSRLREDHDSRLAAWALTCSARAHRLKGDAEAARQAIEEALAMAYEPAPRIAPPWMLGYRQRAENFVWAAYLAVEREEPEKAWGLLFDLDELSIDEAARRRCREGASPEDRVRWKKLEADLAAQVSALGVLASPQRRQDQLLGDLKMRLHDLWRQWPGCESPLQASDAGLRYRAFALDDEIVLLRRQDDGTVEIERRTPFLRADLRRLHDRILATFELRDRDDDTWRTLLRPVAAALLPRASDIREGLVTYALNGLLQTVPLSILPLPAAADAKGAEPREGGGRWLGESVIVTLQPAGAQSTDDGGPADSSPLFVVDPRSNLSDVPQLRADYRRHFPTAHILSGDDATHSVFRQEAIRADWLHVDAHGLYDPVCPHLSALQLADRPIHWVELADTPMNFRFAHLSGCQTGRWPVTPDSGSYGIAGLVTRLGTGWAIASRTDLADRVATEFNRVFYESIGSGSSVPEAYHRALRSVAAKHPAGAWGGLVLLRAAGAG